MVFQYQTPLLGWPRLSWLDPNMHTMNLLCLLLFWTLKKHGKAQTIQWQLPITVTNHKLMLIYLLAYMSSCNWSQFTVTPMLWVSEEYSKIKSKFHLSIVAFFPFLFIPVHSFFFFIYLSTSPSAMAHSFSSVALGWHLLFFSLLFG